MADTHFSDDATRTLLDKLANDDEFREQMLGNPTLALHSIGINVDPQLVPAVRKLPSKADIRANLDALQTKLAGKSGLIFFLV